MLVNYRRIIKWRLQRRLKRAFTFGFLMPSVLSGRLVCARCGVRKGVNQPVMTYTVEQAQALHRMLSRRRVPDCPGCVEREVGVDALYVMRYAQVYTLARMDHLQCAGKF